jgi:hypothetical protein
MDYLAFPLRIEPSGGLARSSGAEENLLRLLRIILLTPDRGWAGFHNFGLRDALPEISFKVSARQAAVKRMNNCLSELAIDWVEVKTIEIDPASDAYEPVYLLKLFYKGKGEDTHQIKL